jgi:hypothetical protein
MAEINKIVYQFPYPFEKRDYDRFGVETFVNSGFDVRVWDMTDYFVPDYRRRAKANPDPVDFAGLLLFSQLDDILKAVNGLDRNAFVFNFLSVNVMSYPILRAFSERGIPHAAFMINSVPSLGGEDTNGSMIGRLRALAAMTQYRLKHLSWARVRNYAFKLSPLSRGVISTPALFVVDGAKSYRAAIKSGTPDERILKTHALDYDLCLKAKEKPPLFKDPIAVFIDDGFPHHPDYQYLKVNPQITADVYFPLLRRFFDEIEQVLGLQVVIAIHPRPIYKEPAQLFGNREIIRGRTVELVRDANLVMLSCSTAVNFAVLWNKPTLFVTTDQVNRNYGEIIKAMANFLGSPLLNLNQTMEVNPGRVFAVNDAGYHNYRNEFIKMDDSPHKYFWEIVRDRLSSGVTPVLQ